MFYYILNQRCRKCEHAEIDEEKEIFRCKMTNQDIRVIDRIQAECMTYVREHPEVIEEENRQREARDLLHKRAQSAFRACENVLNEIFTTATPADQIVKHFSDDLAAARNTLSSILGDSPVWHAGPVEAETNGAQDEVSIIAWRTSGGKRIIEWTPYCPQRDGTWKEFIYCFRILYWCYEKDLFAQAEREAGK
jgi:hypothetical protein